MNFETPLIKGKVLKRYKRFLADIVLESGETVTAHCPNTGSMKTCWEPNATVYLSKSDSPTRKLKYTWEYTKTPGGYIGINTGRPNQVVAEGIDSGHIPELAGYNAIKREVKFGMNSRIDILLTGTKRDLAAKCWVEVKNVTLLANNSVLFPDAVTERGRKHLGELVECVRAGDRAVMFYLVNRPEGLVFGPAIDIDPGYGRALAEAYKQGVEILAYRAASTLSGIAIGDRVPVILEE